MNKVVVLDIETTGLVKYVHGIIAIGGLIYIDNHLIRNFTFNINPASYGAKIDPKALEYNGYTEEMLTSFDDAATVAATLVQLLAKYVDTYDRNDKFQIMAHNAQFDTGFMQEMFRKVNNPNYGSVFSYHDLCTLSLASWKKFQGVELPQSLSLKNLASFFKLDNRETKPKDPLSDCYLCYDIYKGLTS